MTEDQKEPKKVRKVSSALIAGVIIIIIVGAYLLLTNPSTEPEVKTLSNADVQLYKFDKLTNSVEIWLLNLGEQTATDVKLHLRVRNYNGTILFNDYLQLSTLILRYNETCTGIYTIPVTPINATPTPDSVKHFYYTIEISWDTGRNTYSRES